MSLYANYVKERTGQDCLETDHYFITYSIQPDVNNVSFIFIHDFYIKPEKRRGYLARRICTSILQLGKESNCKYALSQIDCTTNNATSALKFQLSMGGVILSAANNLITMCLTLE